MPGQLYKGLVAVPYQFRGYLVFSKCFNCSLAALHVTGIALPYFLGVTEEK
jgi:hypothetical protein